MDLLEKVWEERPIRAYIEKVDLSGSSKIKWTFLEVVKKSYATSIFFFIYFFFA